MSDFASRGYKNPEVLVSTEWVAEHLNDPDVRIIESNEDPLVYPSGHIPGAIEVDWTRDLNHPVKRDFLDQEMFQTLIRRLGADENTTFVIYGDKNNWWASYAFYIFKMFNVPDVRIMEGGRLKWVKEGRELSKEHPRFEESSYIAPERDNSNRYFRSDVNGHIDEGKRILDVRHRQEFTGEALHMPGYLSDGALRAGRMPGAVHIHWEEFVHGETACYKSYDEIMEIYRKAGISSEDDIMLYCRIGKRSSHHFFVMKYLMGFDKVHNYDAGWLEWGNLMDARIEK